MLKLWEAVYIHRKTLWPTGSHWASYQWTVIRAVFLSHPTSWDQVRGDKMVKDRLEMGWGMKWKLGNMNRKN